MKTNSYKGIVYAVSAAFISGFSIYYNKFVIWAGTDPNALNIIKNGGAGLILLILFHKKILSFLGKINRKQIMILFALATVGGGIPFILFFEGLKTIPAANASFIHKTLFVWTALFAVIFLKEKLLRANVIGYLLVILAIFSLGLPSFTGGKGELMVFGATLLWSVEYVIAKKALKKIAPEIISASRMSLGTFFIFLFLFSAGKSNAIFQVNGQTLLTLIPSMIMLSMYTLFLFKALSLVPAVQVTSLLVLSVPITVLLSSGVNFNRIFTPQLSNLLFTTLGVILASGTYNLILNRIKKGNETANRK